MEKYTVDIDKVLDEFEESEALEKVLGPQITTPNIFTESWGLLNNGESKDSCGSKVSADLKVLTEPHCDSVPKDGSIIEHSNRSGLRSGYSDLSPQHGNCNENPRLFDYEIFYKPFQPITVMPHQSLNENGTLENAKHSVSSESNVHLLDSDINLCNTQEEILCVSVQKKDCASKNSCESTVEMKNKVSSPINPALQHDSESKLSHNSFLIKTENIPSSYENKSLAALDFKCEKSDLSKNLDSPIDIQKICSKDSFAETLHDQLSSKVQIDQVTDVNTKPSHVDSFVTQSPGTKSLQCLTDTESSLRPGTENSTLKGSAIQVSQSLLTDSASLDNEVEGRSAIFSTSVLPSVDVKGSSESDVEIFNHLPSLLPVTKAEYSEKVLNEVIDCPTSSALPDFSTIDFFGKYDENVTVEEMNEYLEDLSDADPIQDEDSGVSSQEDINGNAFTSETLKKELEDLSVSVVGEISDCSRVQSASNLDIVTCDMENESSMIKKSEIPESIPSDLKYSDANLSNMENLKILSLKQKSTLHYIPEVESNIGKVSKLANTCQKLDSASTNLVTESSMKESDISEINSELQADFKKSQVNNSVIQNNFEQHNLNRCLNELNENIDSNAPVCSETSCTEDNIRCQGEIGVESCIENKVLTNVGVSQESHIESVNVNKSNSSDLKNTNDTAGSIAVLNCDEVTESNALNTEQTAYLPQKLQRPTTLDLPSRHVAKIDSVDETSTVPNKNLNKPLDETNVIDTPQEEPKISGSVEYVKPVPQIGVVKPFWIPDSDAPNCMHCGVKFTVIKRRHHCRACGKVLCSRCCNQKARLLYLQNKEDRICQPCAEILSSASQIEKIPVPPGDSQSSSSCGSSPNFSPTPQVTANTNFNDKNAWRPHPNNPDDYCSTIPPLQQIQMAGTQPPPTVMVPIGVLKRGNKPRREPKQVIFSDGIRPGGDLTDLTEPADVVPAYRRIGRRRVDKIISGDVVQTSSAALNSGTKKNASFLKRHRRLVISDSEGPLPPILLPLETSTDEKMDFNQLLLRLHDDEKRPIIFAITKNMHVVSQITKLDCCFGKECWCFTSHGLCTVGQDEVMIILEKLPEEKIIPRDIFKLFTKIYDSASKYTIKVIDK